MIFRKNSPRSSSSSSLLSRSPISSLCSGEDATWLVLKVMSMRFLPMAPESVRRRRAKYLSDSFSGIMPVDWRNWLMISLLSLT